MTSDKKTRLRTRAITELVKTEETYVNHLQNLIKYYVGGLENNKLVSKADYVVLFPNDLKMICNLNGQLLKDLQKRVQECSDDSKLIVSNILIDFAPFFKMYQNYMNNNHKQQAILKRLSNNRSFEKFENNLRPQLHNLGLGALLILPIQRVIETETLFFK